MVISGIEITKLKVISNPKGDVFHILKSNETSFEGFGEVYMSAIRPNVIKAWKKHTRMTCNFVVLNGKLKIVVFDDRKESETFNEIQEFIMSRENYFRLTIPPGLWFGFVSLSSEESQLLNVASCVHDPSEVLGKSSDFVKYNNWFKY